MFLCLTAGRQRAACQINYKSIETSAFSRPIASFEWIFSEGDRAVQPFFFLSHNIYPCLSFSMNKRVCAIHLDFIYIDVYKYTCPCIHIEMRNWEKNLFLQATDTIFLSNEITNWNYWRITIKNEIWTCVLICLTIFSFRDRINNGYRSMVIWSLDWTKKKLLRVNIRSKIRSKNEKKNLHIWHLRWDRKAKTDAINRRACGSIYLH